MVDLYIIFRLVCEYVPMLMLVGVEFGLLRFLAINLYWKICMIPDFQEIHLGIP